MLPSRRRVLVSDTVGFIRNLPTTLVKAFRATLEEVTEAALVLHVVDVSSPAAAEHTAHVLKVLAEIGAAEIPQILVMNKIDLLPDRRSRCRHRPPAPAGRIPRGHADTRAVAISALTGAGIDRLLAAIDECCRSIPWCAPRSRLLAGDGATLALLHEFGKRALHPLSRRRCVRGGGGDPGIPRSAACRLAARNSTDLWKTLWESLALDYESTVKKGTYNALNQSAAIWADN